jgi:hypothetical protein
MSDIVLVPHSGVSALRHLANSPASESLLRLDVALANDAAEIVELIALTEGPLPG